MGEKNIFSTFAEVSTLLLRIISGTTLTPSGRPRYCSAALPPLSQVHTCSALVTELRNDTVSVLILCTPWQGHFGSTSNTPQKE